MGGLPKNPRFRKVKEYEMPDDGEMYTWDEPEQKWDLIEADQTA
jgi:hypothetical protein